MDFWFWFWFGLLVMIVATQTITTWSVFYSVSSIDDKITKMIQSIMFCGIISLLIIGSVFNGKTYMAVGGGILEMLINFYYYAQDFFHNGFSEHEGKTKYKRKDIKKSVIRFYRRYWIRLIFGITIPMAIYFVSEYMKESV